MADDWIWTSYPETMTLEEYRKNRDKVEPKNSEFVSALFPIEATLKEMREK